MYTFRGALGSVNFHRMRKEAIQLLHIQEKHLADMHKELRYQVKTHAVSDMPRKRKNPAIFPHFLFFIFIFFIKKNAIWK